MHIEELNWNDFSSDKTNRNCFDLILAAGRQQEVLFNHPHLSSSDVVYDPSVIDNLVKTIRILLQTNRQSSAYIANAIRNDSTYAQFQQALRSSWVSSEESHQSSLTIHSVSMHTSPSIEILRINNNNNNR